MLKHPLPGALRRRLGLGLVFGLALCGGYTAWAAQPGRAAASDLRFDESMKALRVLLTVGGQRVQLVEHEARQGAKESLVQDSEGFAFEYEITALDERGIELTGSIRHRGKLLSQPTLRFERGDHASITLTGADHGLPVDATYDFCYGIGREFHDEPSPGLGPADRIDVSYAARSPPEYPSAAIGEKKEGRVLLRVQVGSDGSASKVEIEKSSGDARLDESARAKVADWRFNPARDRGKPVESWVLVPVTFSLNGEPVSPGKPALPAGALDEIYINAPKD